MSSFASLYVEQELKLWPKDLLDRVLLWTVGAASIVCVLSSWIYDWYDLILFVTELWPGPYKNIDEE